MNEDTYISFDEKRRHLIAEIARQRGELSEAYNSLSKPIHYAEYGLTGFGFLRKNTWVFVAVPAALKVATFLFAIARGKSVQLFPQPEKRPRQQQRQRFEEEDEKPPKGVLGHAVRWAGHGFRLFKLYRRVRRYFP